jgi:hypothetical protein
MPCRISTPRSAGKIMPSNIKPVGVGDLLVVKQQIIGYEATEVAFIENILKGETHAREVRRAETVEQSTTTETEHVSEEERDLQSTERFEMRRESEQVASMDGKLRSPAYGGLVEFSSSQATPVQGSLKTSEQQASTYGKEVTSRAVSKITERVRTQIVQRTVREFEEKTAHTFENKEGAGNITGVYQWIDKVYHNQVFKYDKRLLYDVIVPEPGAFLLQAFARAQSEGRELIKPQVFNLTPHSIDEHTYGYWATIYDATGIEPPPPQYVTVCKAFGRAPASMNGEPELYELALPPGYKALKGYARFTVSPFSSVLPVVPAKDGPFPHIQVIVGEYGPFEASFWVFPPGGSGHIAPSPPPVVGPLERTFWLSGSPDAPDDPVDKIPIVVTSWYIISYALAIGITCKRTNDSFSRWQMRTHAVIMQAYLRKKAEYEERLANLLAALRAGAIGQSEEQKRKLENDELKKSCISIFTNQFYDGFGDIDLVTRVDPITGAPVPYAQIRLPDAEIHGTYIRFFEQAFEWEQVMHALYSYFWARKDYWMGRVTIEDRDEAFADFLKAGAARVVVPVRKGFEKAVIHFMEKGVIWDGGDLPEINTPLYVPLIAEIKAAANTAGTETPYGEPWKLHLPTTLVQLRADGKLPAWKQVGAEWVPE